MGFNLGFKGLREDVENYNKMWKEAAVVYLEGMWKTTTKCGMKQLWSTYWDCEKLQKILRILSVLFKIKNSYLPNTSQRH